MTALLKYQRLECRGLWRAGTEAQRREVVVVLGDASLMLSDPRSGVALSHWSLPAVARRNPGESPALYAPDTGGDETVEIDDADMIEALETVRKAVQSGRRGPTRLRGLALAGLVLAGLLVTLFWLPDALIRHAATVMPPAQRLDLGRAVVADLQAAGIAVPCRGALGQRALGRLNDRLAPALTGARPTVMAGPPGMGAHALPGGIVVLGEGLLNDPASAESVAGFLLAAGLGASLEDPLLPMLRHAGALATARMLTGGALPSGALDGYGATLVARESTLPPADALLALFAQVEVSSVPLAYAIDPSGEATLPLIEGDPVRGTAAPRPVLSDTDWIALQGICEG